jgi:hypothetical protein
MAAIQMEFWKTPEQCEIDALRLELAAVRKSCDAVRRKLFAEQAPLKKDVLDMKNRLEILERGICYGQTNT